MFCSRNKKSHCEGGSFKAGNGNRTRLNSLGSYYITTMLYPHGSQVNKLYAPLEMGANRRLAVNLEQRKVAKLDFMPIMTVPQFFKE